MNEASTQAERDAEYRRERESAEADGTALPELVHDFPPGDLFHAAQQLAQVLQAQPGGKEAANGMNLSLEEPALWGMLDVERAVSLVRERFEEAWPDLAARFPWLNAAVESGEGDAVSAMANQF